MTLDSATLKAWLEDTGALQSGHFLLSSGLHSSAYVQCALLLELPLRARRVGDELAERVRKHRPDSILSPALGGLIIGHEVAAALEVPFRFVERVGTEMQLRRGFALSRGERVVVVEDVVTTGKSTLEAARVARGLDAEVSAVAAILDRTAGADPFEVPFVSLYELDLPSFEVGDCPLCAAREPLSKPGSRSFS